MTCASCGGAKRKGTIFRAGTEDAAGSLCIDCFEELRTLARTAKGCVFGDCPAEYEMQRDPLNRLDDDLGHRPRIPILCEAHRRNLGS